MATNLQNTKKNFKKLLLSTENIFKEEKNTTERSSHQRCYVRQLKPETKGFMWNNGGINAEAAAQTCSVKKMFLKILQNLHENTSTRVPFLPII